MAAVQINGTVKAVYSQPLLTVAPLYSPSLSPVQFGWALTRLFRNGLDSYPNPEDIYQRITSGVTVIFSGPG